MLDSYRNRPEVLFAFPFAIFLTLNLIPWPGYSYLQVVFNWATFRESVGLGQSIFLVTYSSAIVLFCFYLYALKNRIVWWRNMLLSFSAMIGPVAVFEVTYDIVGKMVRPELFLGTTLAGFILNASWITLGICCLPYWKLSKIFSWMLAVYLVIWGAWALIGFPQIYDPNSSWAYVMNAPLKLISFGLYASLLTRNLTSQPISPRSLSGTSLTKANKRLGL